MPYVLPPILNKIIRAIFEKSQKKMKNGESKVVLPVGQCYPNLCCHIRTYLCTFGCSTTLRISHTDQFLKMEFLDSGDPNSKHVFLMKTRFQIFGSNTLLLLIYI